MSVAGRLGQVMKVLIDGRILGSVLTGVERYILELTASIAALQDSAGGFTMLVGREAPSDSILLPTLRGDIRRVLQRDYDVYHRPFQISDRSTIIQLAGARASVLTVHDLIAYHYSIYWEDERKFLDYRSNFAQGLAVADRIICVSEANRRDLLNTFTVDQHRIDVVPHGVDSRFRVIDDSRTLEAYRRRRSLPDDYFLAVGTSYPHKNRLGLLRAFERLRATVPEAKLVLAGARSKQTLPEEDALIARLAHSVVDLGIVPDEELVELYNGAAVFVCPSLYEGFGLPVLEAFACGVPVVCSNLSSLPEVAGDAALLADATDVAEFSEALISVYANEGRRRELREAGLRRAAQFAWKQCAERTMDVYRRADAEVRELFARRDRRISGSRGAKETTSALPDQNGVVPPLTKKFTIAVCTHNRVTRLRRTLDGLAALDRSGIDEVEIVVVDNGSTDGTKGVVDAAARAGEIPVRYFFEPVAGLSYARNRAIRESRGEIILFLDDDIDAPQNLLVEYAKAWDRWPEAACIGGRVELKWLADRPSWLADDLCGLLGKTYGGDNERQYYSPTFYIIGCNMSFRLKVLEQVGAFDPELGYRGETLVGNEENDLMRRIDAAGGQIIYSPHPSLHHLIDDAKLTRGYMLRRYYYQGISDVLMTLRYGGFDKESIKSDKHARTIAILRTLKHLPLGKNWMTDLVWACYHHGRTRALGVASGDNYISGYPRVSREHPAPSQSDRVTQPDGELLSAADRANPGDDLRIALKDHARSLNAITGSRGWRILGVWYRLVGRIKSTLG
ncbi:MAG: glycosyltransferase [Acidobacteria bacterium]|nr:glycosyltransferase [Acidobacteriota bacterium]